MDSPMSDAELLQHWQHVSTPALRKLIADQERRNPETNAVRETRKRVLRLREQALPQTSDQNGKSL
jgi:hypothetical protein